MTQDEVIRMAVQCQLVNTSNRDGIYMDALQAFAKLVAAHTRGQIFKPDWDNYRQGLIDGATAEREACAKVCEWYSNSKRANINYSEECAQAIRARGEA